MVHVHRSGGSQILTAAKAIFLLAAAAILPACGSSNTRDDVNVVIYNVGAEPVLARIEVRHFGDDDTHEVVVMPGDSAGFNYDDVERLAVSVVRTSDNLLLFVDSWTPAEIRHSGDWLGITVAP